MRLIVAATILALVAPVAIADEPLCPPGGARECPCEGEDCAPLPDHCPPFYIQECGWYTMTRVDLWCGESRTYSLKRPIGCVSYTYTCTCT
jgi:hypothetical protein